MVFPSPHAQLTSAWLQPAFDGLQPSRQIVQPLFEQRKIHDAEIVRGGVLLILRVATILIAMQARKAPVKPAFRLVAFQPQSTDGAAQPPAFKMHGIPDRLLYG